jgi:hypothetical protein
LFCALKNLADHSTSTYNFMSWIHLPKDIIMISVPKS